MDGGADNDHLYGGEKDGDPDGYVLSSGHDVVFDFELTEATSDFVLFDGKAKELSYEEVRYGEDSIPSLKIAAGKGSRSITLVGITAEEFFSHQPFPPIINPEPGEWPPTGEGPGFGFEPLVPRDGSLIIGTDGSDDQKSDAQFPKDQKFVGTEEANIIVGLEGDDTVAGGDGDDLLLAGEGSDW